MKKKQNISLLALIILLLLLVKQFTQLYWWVFVIPVLILGAVITRRNRIIPAFAVGFLAGFITWFGSSLYFDSISNGIIMSKIGLLLTIPKIVVFLISGVVGGLLTGLALYTGKAMVSKKPAPVLDAKVE